MKPKKRCISLKAYYQKRTHFEAVDFETERFLLKNERVKLNSDTKLLNETLHEVRMLNNQIKALTEQLISKIDSIKDEAGDKEAKEIENIFKTLRANTSLLSIRMNAYDAIFNPEMLAKDMFVLLNVFGKVEKVYKCLYSEKKKKGVSINLYGTTNQMFFLNDTIELAFFIIIENAIKYSYPTSTIEITFIPNYEDEALNVEFKNWGLRPKSNEMSELCERGFRSSVAKDSNIAGSGLGLYILQKICSVNKVGVDIHLINDIHYYDGYKYSPFVVTLHFGI